MDKYCTNCGHANNSTHQNCVECGTLLNEVIKVPKGPKKPMSFKAKIVTSAGVILLAALIGFYTWGTKAASAETTISKFFDALQKKEASDLRNYIVLSNGEKLSKKEAEAFIDLYQNITPAELTEIALIEKKGKVAGIFDAYKVSLNPQQLSFNFPYKGLSLMLNGEPVESRQNGDGDYTFSGIVPGTYKAEFFFEDGQTKFSHPFGLTVENQWDSSYAAIIEEELPIDSVVFQVEGHTADFESRITVGGKEFPVNEEGVTEEIGPLLIDGSMSAQAQVDFPWGVATSDAVAIDSDYMNIEMNKLDEKAEAQIIEQFVLYQEEYFQASGTRDASVYTTLSRGKLKTAKEELESWKVSDYFFKGALSKINLDGESVNLFSGGTGVSVEGEIEAQGAYYYQSQDPALETLKYQSQVVFNFNPDSKKWEVQEVNNDPYYSHTFTVEPMRTIEGSKKMHQVKGSADPVEETANNSDASNDQTNEIEEFMNLYNSESVSAINSGDFSAVSYLISADGPKWKESADYIKSTFAKGITEEHLGTTLEKVEKIDASHVKVTTIDRYIIHGTEKSSEKEYRSVNILKNYGDGWLVNELISTKEI